MPLKFVVASRHIADKIAQKTSAGASAAEAVRSTLAGHWVTLAGGRHVFINEDPGAESRASMGLSGEARHEFAARHDAEDLGQHKPGEKQASAKPAGETDSERKLATLEVAATRNQGGGVNETRVVEFDDGSKAIFKPADGERGLDAERYDWLRENITPGMATEREVAAWQLAKLVGMEDMVAPTIEREINGQRGALLEFEPGSPGGNFDEDEAFDGDHNLSRAAAFDYVIGNEDRHNGNWLVDGDNLHLIDHGLTFPEDKGDFSSPRHAWFIVQAGNKGLSPGDNADIYVRKERQIVQTLTSLGLPKPAINGVKYRIEKLAAADSYDELLPKY